VYEVAIPVRQLARAEAFYREVLELEVGLRDSSRNWLFLRAGGAGGMVVLQESPGEWPPVHFAFTVDEANIERAAALLRERGVAVGGLYFQDGVPGTLIFSSDRDGHQLEVCAPKPAASRPAR